MGVINTSAFHHYAFSDYLDNVVRGSLGEFLVASALEIADTPESSWESWDISFADTKIEVKTSAYVQTWFQKRRSVPRFGIPKKLGWESEINEWSNKNERQADVYVFCLFTWKDFSDKPGARKAILDTENWQFHVVSTEALPEQKSIGLEGLRALAEPIEYDELKNSIISVSRRG